MLEIVNALLCLPIPFCPFIILPFHIPCQEWSMRGIVPVVLMGLAVSLFSACGNVKQPAAQAVENYVKALVAKNSSQLSTLSCATWEPSAMTELDSLQAVQAKLQGLDCSVSGTDGATTLVTCKGKIVVTYNNENQELDLSNRTYQVVQQGGDYLMCGYR
jgi:hypothetical protein